MIAASSKKWYSYRFILDWIYIIYWEKVSFTIYLKETPSKLEVAPPLSKMWTGLDG